MTNASERTIRGDDDTCAGEMAMIKAVPVVVVCLLATVFLGTVPEPTSAALSSDWSSPVQLGPTEDEPAVDVSSNGTAITAWSNEQLMVSMYYVESGWTPSHGFVSGYARNYFADVAISDGGNATVVWCAWGTPYDVLASMYVPGSGWGSPILLNSLACDPKVAMDDEGNAVVIYRDMEGTYENIWAIKFDAALGWWESPVKIQNGSADADGLAVAMTNSGDAIAIWTEDIGSRYAIMASRYTPTTNWSPPEQIDSAPDTARWDVDIAMNSYGNAIASWAQYRLGVGMDIWANSYTVGTGWEGPELMENDDQPDSGFPDADLNENGEAVVCWAGGTFGNGTTYDVYVNRYEPGTGWLGYAVVENDLTNPAYDARGVIDDQGEIVVAWYTNILDPFSIEIRSTRYSENTGWEDYVAVASCDPYHGMTLDMAKDGAGNAVLVWNDIWTTAAIYDRPDYAGSVITTDDLGNQNTVFVQGQPVHLDVSVLFQGVPSDVEVNVTLEGPNNTVHEYFTVNTSDPAVGWYNSSEASVSKTLATGTPLSGDQQDFDVVVRISDTGYEIGRVAITIVKEGLRFSPVQNNPWYAPSGLIDITLYTSHSTEVFYVHILDEMGSVADFNWTALVALSGEWHGSFIVPDTWETGNYTLEVRSEETHVLWYSESFLVTNSPPTADAGVDLFMTVGELAVFNGSGSSDDGGITNWTWTFEYGGNSHEMYGATPSFQFNEPGTYVVTLNVTDGVGNNASDSMTVTVEILVPEMGVVSAAVLFTAVILAALLAARRRRDDH